MARPPFISWGLTRSWDGALVLVQLTCGLRRLVMCWLVLALAVALVGLGAPAATAAATLPTASGAVGRLVTLQGVYTEIHGAPARPGSTVDTDTPLFELSAGGRHYRLKFAREPHVRSRATIRVTGVLVGHTIDVTAPGSGVAQVAPPAPAPSSSTTVATGAAVGAAVQTGTKVAADDQLDLAGRGADRDRFGGAELFVRRRPAVVGELLPGGLLRAAELDRDGDGQPDRHRPGDL